MWFAKPPRSVERNSGRTAAKAACALPQTREVERRRSSSLQEFSGLVERAKRNAGFREGFGGAFFAVAHGEHQHDLAAGLAHRLGRLQRRAAGGGDVLDDHHALAVQALALGEALDREPGAMP